MKNPVLKREGYLPFGEFLKQENVTKVTVYKRLKKGLYVRYIDPFSGKCFYKSAMKRGPISIKTCCFRLGYSRNTIIKYVKRGYLRACTESPLTFDEQCIKDFQILQLQQMKFEG